MALSSSSTLTTALAQYNDNLSWEGNSAKAVLFLEAIRWLLGNRPMGTTIQGRTINYNALETQKAEVAAFVGKFSDSVNRASFVRGKMRI